MCFRSCRKANHRGRGITRSVREGSIFSKSRIPLPSWMSIMHRYNKLYALSDSLSAHIFFTLSNSSLSHFHVLYQSVTGFEKETGGYDRGWGDWEQQVSDESDYTSAENLFCGSKATGETKKNANWWERGFCGNR